MKKIDLPEKPSDLILVALEDLEKVEKSKTYKVFMEDWHNPFDGKKCEVCFAGSVMAMEGRLSKNKYVEADKCFDEKTWEKFYALNNFRRGMVVSGLNCMGIDAPDLLCEADMKVFVPDYDRNPSQFKADMLAISDMLKLFNL